jgi:parvulin-like peptidyl-prolyl isomerase
MSQSTRQHTPLLPAAVALLGLCLSGSGVCSQVLATVGSAEITDTRLAQAMASAPFATTFPSMDEAQQAAIRGDMLARLVYSEVLRQEALAAGIDKDPAFIREVEDFRTRLRYRRYIQSLRDAVVIPDDVDAAYKTDYRGNPDALAAARSTYIARHFRELKTARMQELKSRHHVRLYQDRLRSAPDEETVIAEGDFFTIRSRDIAASGSERGAAAPVATGDERLEDRVEVILGARAAQDSGIDVETEVVEFRNDLLPRLLIERKEREWLPDEATLRDYYQRHAEKWRVPERRHIGQLVLGTRAEAEAMRSRIMAGESLFVLAGEHSIDPLGREQAGDMGWLKEDSGYPALEAAVKELRDGDVSAVIETPLGYHIVTVIERRPGQQLSLAEIPDRVRQSCLSEQLSDYLQTLMKKYPVTWSLPIVTDDEEVTGTAAAP